MPQEVVSETWTGSVPRREQAHCQGGAGIRLQKCLPTDLAILLRLLCLRPTELCDKNRYCTTVWSAIAINKYRRGTDVGAAFGRWFRCRDGVSERRNITVIAFAATFSLVRDACFPDSLLAG